MEFKVKRDFIPIFIINIILLLICACSIIFFFHWTGWLIIVIIVDLLVLIGYDSSVIFAKCTITEDKLIYRTGMFKYSIPLDKIAKVTKAKNYHVSLALSIDRVRILVVGETGRQCAYYISVQDSNKFIKVLKPNPELKKVKDEVAIPLTEVRQEEVKQEVKEETVNTADSSAAKKPATKKATTAKNNANKKTTATSKSSAAKKAE